MVIVAGHITVDPSRRESYLAGGVRILEIARAAQGCLDISFGADLIDPSRINLFERWESREALDTFRTSGGASDEQPDARLAVSVEEYDIAEVRPLFG
ncbi:putative quinol monooxygenase [Antrihabitans stalactiti]|uniref:Antibiotic biosynthesis monooxygenase n=1 Tax=Antrihabitans stalactiti TaxID=2584121 RepID=A0A848KPP6_9NOCA|nr:antibiotic biosynthesis monooxygenase [Antrihabitans stalactiti]NMN98572.1 antibiotic biosynthesis monooxygenase [Antrihabitans stalactiti]